MSHPLTLCTILLAITTNLNAADQALDAKQLTLIVQHKNSAITIRLNGMPMRQFGDPGRASSDTIGTIALLAINGENVLGMETNPVGDAADSETTFKVIVNTGSMADFDRPIFEKKFAGAGKTEFKVTLREVPHWAYQDADPWKGDTQGLLDAVKAMHKAAAAGDIKAFAEFMRPGFDDMKALAGDQMPPWDQAVHYFGDSLKGKVNPLPAKLKVASAYGDRLFAVTSESDAAPIQIVGRMEPGETEPALPWELGRFWIHSKGAWQFIRE